MSNSALDRAYLSLPAFLQNIAVSLKGLQIRATRTGGIYAEEKAAVHRRNSWTASQHEQYQLERLRGLLSIAKHHVPYYRSAYSNVPSSAYDLQQLSDIGRFPLMSKPALREDSAQFVDERQDLTRLMQLHTTGTTGTPLTIYCDRDARRRNYAFFDAFLEDLGVQASDRRVVIGGRILVSQDATKGPFWRHNWASNSVLMSSYHMTEANLGSYVRFLDSWSPVLLEGYPSSLSILAQYVLEHGLSLKSPPRVIVTSSETLLPQQREQIERAFGARVSDQYGAVEMCLFVYQCTAGSYHARPDYGLLEVLDANDREVGPGESGRAVATGFVNSVMPLIRYPIGDRVTKSVSTACECGAHSLLLEGIDGREDDYLRTPDGRTIGRVSPILKGFPVVEAQYRQDRLDRIQLLIVPADSYDPDTHTSQIHDELKKRFGSSVSFDIRFVEQIPRGPGAKLKTVVSLLKDRV